MLILIYGEDTYRSRQWARELETKFREKFDTQGYNVSSFDGDTDLNELRAAICAPPFLGTKRMIQVKRLIETAGKDENLITVLAQIPESSIVVLWEEGEEKAFAKIPLFAKMVRGKENKTYPFPLLKGASLETWARTHAKSLDIEFERGALTVLVNRVNDLWQLSAELEKCAALKVPVTTTWVNENVHGQTPENIFAFVDALAARDAKKVMAELRTQRENDLPVPYLLTMIARQFRMLRQAQNYLEVHPGSTAPELAEVFGWHPFVAKKTLVQAHMYFKEILAANADAIFEADRSFKSGKYDQNAALDLLLAKLLGVEVVK
jgi:DNA polymerase-3 subunit delta